MDQNYFERLKEQLINFVNHNQGEFSERQIQEVRERMNRFVDETQQERRDPQNHQATQQNYRIFVEQCIGFIIFVLQHVEPQNQRNVKQAIRAATLELLIKKGLIQQHISQQIIEQLTIVIEKDNEINASTAIRILNDILKMNQQQSHQMRQNFAFSESQLLKLYKFFEERIQFLVKFNQELKQKQYKKLLGDSHNNPFHDQNYIVQHDQDQNRETRMNIHSISFLTYIPMFFIFTMYGFDSIVREETKNQIRDILRKALKTMAQAINETQFQEILQKVPRNIVSDIFQAYGKFIQLFCVVIKRDENTQNAQQQSKMIKDIQDSIKLDQVVALIIKLLKFIPIDIMNLRIDISQRLKMALQYKRDPVQAHEINDKFLEIQNNYLELIEEETIVGKSLKIPSAQKTNIYHNWLEIIKYLVLTYLPKNDTQNAQPSNFEKTQSDFINNQAYMEKIFNTIFKILFDSSLQLQIHEKALDLIKQFLELFQKQNLYFIDRSLLQYYVESQQQQQNDSMFKELTTHSSKYKLLDRLFNMIGMKLGQVRKQICQVKEMLQRTKRWDQLKKTTTQTNVSSMPCNADALNETFIDQLENYIKEVDIDIDQNLITQQEQTATQVYTFDDEEDYQVNGISITTYSQYVDFAKDVKTKIFDQLNDILGKLFEFVKSTNKEIAQKYKLRQNFPQQTKSNPFIQATNENKPYLSNLQCHYMSKIMKNGLLIFEELHDHQRNHFEILDYKKKTIYQFMLFFTQFHCPINFKNIFEPNAKLLLRLSVSLIKTCPENHCLQSLLQDHLNLNNSIDPTQQQQKHSIKYYIEFLLNLYLKELQTTPELPLPFGYCRGGQLISLNNCTIQQKDQDEYISLIQKLLRIPIRLFPRVRCAQNEEPIVKPLVKQLILFFVKKAHQTYYPIDFLGLLLSLVKRIQNNDMGEGLSKYFQQLCDKQDKNDKQGLIQKQQCDFYHKINLSGVNIVLNMFELFQTGIVEIQDIVAEVIANFPLQRTIQINLAKQYPVFAHCLFRALHNISTIENQVIQKTLIILENIVTHLTMEEMKLFFGDLLQPFIEKLLTFPSEYKMSDIYSKQTNLLMDPAFKSLKIISKLGELARKPKWPIEIKRNHNDNPFKHNQNLEIKIENLQHSIQINLNEMVRCSVEILQNVLEQQLATYLFKQSSIQHSYSIVKMVLLGYYQMPIKFNHDLYSYSVPKEYSLSMHMKSAPIQHHQILYQDEELINQVTKVFIGLSNFHNIIQTLTTATFLKIKEDVENVVTTLSEMFFIQLGDDHCTAIEQLKDNQPDILSQHEMVESIVHKYLTNKQPSIQWISHLFRGLTKRYMLTAEENMNLKDFYIMQHEFIWNKLLMGNCLKKYQFILQNHFKKTKKNKWAYDVYYSVMIKLFEEFVFDKFGKQTQLQKEDERRKKIQIVQSYGGTMIPSEGLNGRSISIELLIEIQKLLPNYETYTLSETITGLPYLPDQQIFQCSFILLSQLPETIKVISQQLCQQLLKQTLNGLIMNIEYTKGTYQLKLQDKLRILINIITNNCYTYKGSILNICLDLYDCIIKQLYKGDSTKLFYMNLEESMNPNFLELVQQIPLDQYINQPSPIMNWINVGFSEISTSPHTNNTVLRELIDVVKLLCSEKKMNDIVAQCQANGFKLLSYLLSKGQPYYLFKLVKFDGEPILDQGIDEFIQLSFTLIQQNEEQYSRICKLILSSDDHQQPGAQQANQPAAHINLSHALDDLEYKINIEDIDFEIKWQSNMVVSIYSFLKQIAIIPYLHLLQRNIQKNIDKNIPKPAILAMKFKTVEILYEGLLRVEHSIRSAGYKYLQELLQQEGLSNDKTLFENDERLKKVMKPLLTCVQSEIFHYVPSFLKSLKLILKIFNKVFHKALSDKLHSHMQRIVQDQGITIQGAAGNPMFCTMIEWSLQQVSTQESLNFQMGIVSGLLKLFQHLTQQLTNQQNGQQNSIVQRIITDTNQLRRNYLFKISQQQLNLSVDKPLVKFLNTLAANHFDIFSVIFSPQQIQTFQKQLEQIGQLMNNQTSIKQLQEHLRERLKLIKTIRQVLSEPTAFPLREKLCREKSSLPSKIEKFSKTIEELSGSLEKGLQTSGQGLTTEQLQTFHQSLVQKLINVISELKIEIVQFGFQLCKKNPSWLKRNQPFLDNCILNNIKELLERQKINNNGKRLINTQIQFAYNQLILSNQQINTLLKRHASMLKQYINQNEDNKQAIQAMIKLILYSTQDKVRKWIFNIARFKSESTRKKIIEIWMESFKYVDDEATNQVQMVAGYQIIYPIISHSYWRGDLNVICDLALFHKMKEINDEVVKIYSNIQSDVEHQVPINFSYKMDGLSPKLSDANNYYKASVIDMLQISSYFLCFYEQQLPQELKMSFLQFGYDMINKSDKLVAFYANLYFSKFLKKNGLIQNDRVSVNKRYLKIYGRAIKQLDESNQYEQELYSLCKKIISVVLPCLDEGDPNDQRDWIQSTQQMLKQEQQQLDAESAQKVSRFWTMFIRNHKIFHKHHESFTIHIINSMQQIGFFNGQPQVIQQSQQNYKRIALDMAFLQVEWKAKQLKNDIQGGQTPQAKKFRESFYQSEAHNHDESLSSEIYQSFFIKQSLKAFNLEDQELQRRALYLFKKILIIAPLTNHKMNMDTIKKNVSTLLNQIQEPQQSGQNARSAPQQPTLSPYFRYFMITLNILLIITEFQPLQRLPQLFQPYLDIIFHMNQISDQIQQQPPRPTAARIPSTQARPQPQSQSRLPYNQPPIDRQQQHQNALAQDHAPLIFSIYNIFRKLLRAAKENPGEQSDQFQQNLSTWVKESIQNHPIYRRQQQQPTAAAFMGSRMTSPLVKVNVLSIFLLKLFFNYDVTYVKSLLIYLKRIADMLTDYLKQKDKGEQYLDNLRKYTQQKKPFNLRESEKNTDKRYTYTNLSIYIQDYGKMNDDFPFGYGKSDEQLYFPEDYPENSKLKFHLFRSALQKTLKMMAYNFDEMKEPKEQSEFLHLLLWIIESVPDYELKLECIAILRMLFINGIENKQGYLDAISKYLSPIRAKQIAAELQAMEENTQFKPSKMPFETIISFFFEHNKFQQLFDKKIDVRTADSHDNQHGKIQDLKVFKLYFMFLCELLLANSFKAQFGSVMSGFYILRNILDKSHGGAVKEFRKLLQTVSKMSTCLDYIRFFFKMTLDLFGYNQERFLQFVFGDLFIHSSKEASLIEGEEIMLMAVKFLILGRGTFQPPQSLEQSFTQATQIEVTQVLTDEDSQMRHEVLQKYLSIYYKKDFWQKLFHSSIKLLTSEYLPSIVIYNLSYIPIQDQPQQPLRECIIPSAAIELMGSAGNVSSRILKPIFTQILENLNNIKAISQMTDYLMHQSMSNGALTSISQFLSNYYLNRINEFYDMMQYHQEQNNFNNLIKCLIQKGLLNLAQNLLEQIFQHLNQDEIVTILNEDILVLLQGIYQEQWNKEGQIGIKYLCSTQPWVKQLLIMHQLRLPIQQYQLVLQNQSGVDQFWTALEEETDELQGCEKEYDQAVINYLFVKSLQQLNQWNSLKQIEQSKMQTINNKILMGMRDKDRNSSEQGWKELQQLSDQKLPILQQQNDVYCYNQAFFKLLDYLKDENSQNQRIGNPIFSAIEQNFKQAQIINCYNFIKTLPKLTQSYDQTMCSPLVWGKKYLNFVSQFQLYTELEESLKQYAPQTQQQYASSNQFDSVLENITNAYQSSLLCKKYYIERQPQMIDSQHFTFDLISQRMLQMQMCVQRLSGQLTQFLSSSQIQTQTQIDQKVYQLALLDYKTLLYPMRYFYQNGILDMFDEQSVLKDVPKQLIPYAERLFQLERVKFKTQKINEIENNIASLNELQLFFTQQPSNQFTIHSVEEFRNQMQSKIWRFKMINHCYKLLRLQEQESNMQMEEQKLEILVSQSNEFFIQHCVGYIKFWKEAQNVYQLAHKKFSNNIKFAHYYIQITPISIQYKPEKFPLTGIYMFHIVNITNQNDSHVIESFTKTISQIPIQLLERLLIQLVSTFLKHQSDSIRKECLDAIEKICIFNPLNTLQIISFIRQFGQNQDERVQQLINTIQVKIKLNHTIPAIYSLKYLFDKNQQEGIWEILEEIIYICGKILDNKIYDLQSKQIQDKHFQLANMLQKNEKVKMLFYQLVDINEIIKGLTKQNEQIKMVTQLYISSLKILYSKLFNVWFDQTNDFPIQLIESMNSLISKQIQISELYKINQEFNMTKLPMIQFDPKLNSNKEITIVSMFPTVNISFQSRKRLVRQIAFLGNDEKKYLLQMKIKKVEQKIPIQNIMDVYISNNFIKTTHLLNQNYKETKIRNIEHIFVEQYLLEYNKQSYLLVPYQEETQSLAHILDQIVTKAFLNGKIPEAKIPYYPTIVSNMDEIVQKSDLSDIILSFSKTIDTFINIRRIIITNIGVQYALSFITASSQAPKQLDNLQLNLSNGNFFQKKYLFKVQNQKLQLYDSFAIRYSRNFEHLIGEINLGAHLIPAFTATILGILQNEQDLIDYLNVLFWQLGCRDSIEPFLKKLKDIVYDNEQKIDSKCDRLLELSKVLFSGQERVKASTRRWF